MNKTCRIAAGYRILLIGLCCYGILVYSGILQNKFNGEIFSYFTILSVLLALVYFSAIVIMSSGIRSGGESRLRRALAHFKGGVTLATTITMTVYHLLLAPMIFDRVGYQPFSANDIIVHYAIPIMVILDWLLFDPKPAYRATDPLRWLGIPLAYFIFAVIRAGLGGPLQAAKSRYPYFFIDIDALGIGAVLRNALLLAIGFLFIGYVLFFVDRFLGKKNRHHQPGFGGHALMPPAQHYPEPTVGALIFDPEGRLFLMKSHKWAGQYVVPGGHVELGETLEAALRREVAEETGLAICDIRFVCMQEFIYDPAFWRPRHFIFFDYACRTETTEVQLNDEAEEYVWAAVDEALRLQVEPYTERAIRAYLGQQTGRTRA